MHEGSSAAPDIDEGALLARLGGRRDLLLMLVSMFSADVPELEQAFAAAVADRDAATVRRLAHRAVGSLADLCAGELVERGRDLEERATDPDALDALRPDIAAFLAGLAAFEARLRALTR